MTTRLLTDVLCRVKGGKEANVYCCQSHPGVGMELLAAKLYRPRMLRNLRNDARYRQGRDYLDEFGKVIHDSRLLVAIRKGTSIGKETSHTSWLEHEYRTLEVLRAAGLPGAAAGGGGQQHDPDGIYRRSRPPGAYPARGASAGAPGPDGVRSADRGDR